MRTSEPIHLIFSSDAGYSAYLWVAIQSIVTNARSPKRLIFHILTDLNADVFSRGIRYFETHGCSFRILNIDPQIFQRFPRHDHFTHATYYRIVSPYLLCDVNRAIYLDVDIVGLTDIADLQEFDLQGNPLAAVENPGFDRHHALSMEPDSRYFNSGVLLMDLDLLRSRYTEDDWLAEVRKVASRIITKSADQDILNVVFEKQWLPLPAAWNFQRCMYNLERFESANSKIIHFTTNEKPWMARCTHPEAALWAQYSDSLPWTVPMDHSVGLIRYAARMFLPWSMRRIIYKARRRLGRIPRRIGKPIS